MRNNFTCLLSVQPLLCVQPASQVAQWLRKQKKITPAIQEMQFQSLCRKDPLEKEMATHSSSLAWRILWTLEPGGL